MEDFPRIEPIDRGFRIRVSQGAYLPGVYLNQLIAQKAVLKYLGQQVEAKNRRQNKKKE